MRFVTGKNVAIIGISYAMPLESKLLSNLKVYGICFFLVLNKLDG